MFQVILRISSQVAHIWATTQAQGSYVLVVRPDVKEIPENCRILLFMYNELYCICSIPCTIYHMPPSTTRSFEPLKSTCCVSGSRGREGQQAAACDVSSISIYSAMRPQHISAHVCGYLCMHMFA